MLHLVAALAAFAIVLFATDILVYRMSREYFNVGVVFVLVLCLLHLLCTGDPLLPDLPPS